MRAETRLHPDHASWQLLECRHQRQPLDLPAQHQIAITVKAHQMKDILANINTDNHQIVLVTNCLRAHRRFSCYFGKTLQG